MTTIQRNGKTVRLPLSRTDPRHVAAEANRPLPPAIIAAAEAEAPRRGMLAGDLIAALTTALGIPPCGGCKGRREKLNRWHAAALAWLRGGHG